MIPLESQDRTRWDRAAIAEGAYFIQRAMRRGPAGPYAIQAAIASAHVFAPTPAQTDWNSVVFLYDALLRLRPSPVVALNRAAAIAMRDGPEAGLALIDALADDPRLARYPYLSAARADLLRRAGQSEAAANAYREALALVQSDAERRYLVRRLDEVA
jgi:RNA polymerase sigma-70 factor (ECF subfamily)